jgi:ABC-type dipeptide/oligopeptide/nickel transport system ATPase component
MSTTTFTNNIFQELNRWEQCMDNSTFDDLVQFTTCVKESLPLVNQLLVITGESGSGKTTLLNDITRVVGKQNITHVPGNKLYGNPNNHKLLVCSEECGISEAFVKKIVSREPYEYRELYKIKTHSTPTSNIIVVVTNLKQLSKSMLDRSIVINLCSKKHKLKNIKLDDHVSKKSKH